MLECLIQRHIGAGDRRRAGAAIGLQHVAIDLDGNLAHLLGAGDGAQRTADQPLDFLGAAALLALCRLAVRAGMGGARQHAVFRRHPALAGIAQERRHAILDGGGAQHMCVAEFGEAGAFGVLAGAGLKGNGAHLIRRTARGSHNVLHDLDWSSAFGAQASPMRAARRGHIDAVPGRT